MRDDIKAERMRKARNLVVWLHIAIVVTSILLEERLGAGTFAIFVALTTCSFVALTALQRKYSDGENERATPKTNDACSRTWDTGGRRRNPAEEPVARNRMI